MPPAPYLLLARPKNTSCYIPGQIKITTYQAKLKLLDAGPNQLLNTRAAATGARAKVLRIAIFAIYRATILSRVMPREMSWPRDLARAGFMSF